MTDEKNNAIAPIENNAVIAMRTANKIAGDVVNKATAELPDNQRSAIRRLHAYYVEHDLSLEETSRLIGKTGAVASLIFRGKYDAGLSSVVKEIEDFFELLDKRAQGRKLEFIKTDLTEQIWKVCDASVEFQKIAFIFGDMQIGKDNEAARADLERALTAQCVSGALTDFVQATIAFRLG